MGIYIDLFYKFLLQSLLCKEWKRHNKTIQQLIPWDQECIRDETLIPPVGVGKILEYTRSR